MQKNTQAAKEQKENKLPANGIYVYKIQGADDKPSKPKNGKPGYDMYTLRLNIFDESGKKRVHKTWVGGWNWEGVQGFFDSLGGDLLERYNAEEAIEAYELVGFTGKLKIQQGKNRDGELQANTYFVPLRDGEESPEVPELQESAPEPTDDDVPF